MSRALPRDQEDRANLAIGALDALDDLLANQYPGSQLPAEPLTYLLRVIAVAVKDAIPNGHAKHGRAINDEG